MRSPHGLPQLVHDQEMTATEIVLYRTAAGKSLHLPSCAHLQDTPIENRIPVPLNDHPELPVCTWTADELAGNGRRYFETLDSAFEALPVPIENRIRVREILTALSFDRVWIPNGGQYVAVGLSGSAAAAYINRGFIEVRLPEGRYEQERFANYGGGSGSSSGLPTVALAAKPCPTCNLEMPATGRCDDCDA